MNPAHDARLDGDPRSALLDDYLTRLEEALELLGPVEAAEIRTEVASYLSEAARDGRVDEVLGTMGAPESFAAGILSERGMLAPPSPLPMPSNARTTVAAVVDVVVALAPLALALPLTLVVPVFSSSTGVTTLTWIGRFVAAGVLLVTIGVWPWYYWRGRKRPGRNQSVGRNVAGLRLVRAGGELRVVRTNDMPHGRRGMARTGAVIGFLVALWIVGGMAYLLGYAVIRGPYTPPDLTLSVVAQDAGSAVGMTTQLTAAIVQAISAGQATGAPPPDLLEGTALQEYPELLESAKANAAETYETQWISETTYVDPESPFLSDATFRVEGVEHGDHNRTLRFTVRKHTEFTDDGMSGVTTYRISHIEIGESWAP